MPSQRPAFYIPAADCVAALAATGTLLTHGQRARHACLNRSGAIPALS
jgi:hypothetical protein